MSTVLIPSPLFSYTGGKDRTNCSGASVGEILADLDRQFPGIRHRIIDEQDQVREHINIYVGGKPGMAMEIPVNEGEEVMIVAALSGG